MSAIKHWAMRSTVDLIGLPIALWAALTCLPPTSRSARGAEAPQAAVTQNQPAETQPGTGASPPGDSQPTEAQPPAATIPAASPPASPAPPPAQAPAVENKPDAARVSPADPAKKMVRLEFRDQEWLPVLQWLADTLNLNLDWQQLPEGTVNLASAEEYRVEDAEDLINMQLLARGFTLLKRGEVLRVAPLKNLDITLVPRVDVDELATLPRHQFVRVTFPLDWMIAEEAAVEFKPLISPYGQLLPMGSSNRLEAIDAVVNLRELHRLLKRAEADEARRERVVEFRLKHRKAEEVAAKVRQLLGVPAEGQPAATVQTQLDIEKFKFRSEAIKQLGTGAQPLLMEKAAVQLVVNEKENSILVSGRPDKIELARQAIEAMDKPEPPAESSWETLNRVRVYPVAGFDPTAVLQLIQALKERGNLQKETQIQHEAAYNRLVVVASPADQLTISKIIEGLRSEGRRAEVLPLQKIDARYATKAVQLVLKNPARPASAPGPPSEGQFQIEPDPTHNRLLLWATPEESAEVRQFLARLGETFAGDKSAANVHVVRLRGAKKSDILERLKRAWQAIGDAPLVIEDTQSPRPEAVTPPTPPDKVPAPPSPSKEEKPEPTNDEKVGPMSDRSAGHRVAAQLVAQQQPVAEPDSAQSAPPTSTAEAAPSPSGEDGKMSPVNVIVGQDDEEMIIVSRDPVAAQAAKEIVEQITPEEPEVRIVTLKNAQAAVVRTQLLTLLAPLSLPPSALDTQKPLSIEADARINRLMIQHATPRQMELIDSLIPMLDQPTQEDERLVREQRIYRAQRKRASEIAEVVKEVYRDLLSTSDKVFDARVSNQPFGYNRAMAASSKSPEYQGLLSVGVDDVGNILVLSAPAYLMDEVMGLVERIDAQAAGDATAVVPVSRAARASVGEALGRLLAKPK
jgi:type II secretory pathway component GspD/PulD (secretin)